MKFKLAAIGLLASAACAVPVLAAHGGHGGQSRTNRFHPIPVTAVGVVCDSDEGFYGERGGFAAWTSLGRKQGYEFDFGQTDSEGDDTVGLRVDAPNTPAISSNVDWDLTEASSPYIVITLNDGSGTDFFIDDFLSNLGSGDGFSFSSLSNGFTRVAWNSANASGFVPGSKFNNLYYLDIPFGGAFEESMLNVLINGKAVTPKLQTLPSSDCTVFPFEEAPVAS